MRDSNYDDDDDDDDDNCFLRAIPKILTLSLCTKPHKLGFVLTASGSYFLALPSETVIIGLLHTNKAIFRILLSFKEGSFGLIRSFS